MRTSKSHPGSERLLLLFTRKWKPSVNKNGKKSKPSNVRDVPRKYWTRHSVHPCHWATQSGMILAKASFVAIGPVISDSDLVITILRLPGLSIQQNQFLSLGFCYSLDRHTSNDCNRGRRAVNSRRPKSSTLRMIIYAFAQNAAQVDRTSIIKISRVDIRPFCLENSVSRVGNGSFSLPFLSQCSVECHGIIV
jgi:hypothetical protein